MALKRWRARPDWDVHPKVGGTPPAHLLRVPTPPVSTFTPPSEGSLEQQPQRFHPARPQPSTSDLTFESSRREKKKKKGTFGIVQNKNPPPAPIALFRSPPRRTTRCPRVRHSSCRSSDGTASRPVHPTAAALTWHDLLQAGNHAERVRRDGARKH